MEKGVSLGDLDSDNCTVTFHLVVSACSPGMYDLEHAATVVVDVCKAKEVEIVTK